MLVTGKTKAAIAKFAYCGTMYQDVLRTLERKFGQPQAVVSASLDKLNHFLALQMHNSENIISYYATNSALVGVFRSLHYVQNLTSETPARASNTETATQLERSLGHAHSKKTQVELSYLAGIQRLVKRKSRCS